MSVRPIFYYLPILQGGPQDQEGVLGGKMHLVKFGNKYTGNPGEFNGRVVVYSHGIRQTKRIRFGKEEEQKTDGETFCKTHFLNGLFSENQKALAALETVELAVCHSGMNAPAFLDGFSRNLPKGVVTRGPIDALRWCGETWKVGRELTKEEIENKKEQRAISKKSSSSVTNYFLKGDIGGLDLFFRSVGEPGPWFNK